MKLNYNIIVMIILALLLTSIVNASKKIKIKNEEEVPTEEEFQKVDEEGTIYLPEEPIE